MEGTVIEQWVSYAGEGSHIAIMTCHAGSVLCWDHSTGVQRCNRCTGLLSPVAGL